MATSYEDLPLKTNHELMWAYMRYVPMLEPSPEKFDTIPDTNIPGTNDGLPVPFIIEAPLNSVEILEAILKPSEPFKIYKARHIHRDLRRRSETGNIGYDLYRARKTRRLYAEYIRFQGRLTEDREISFVCIPSEAIKTLRRTLSGTFCPVWLLYISIPWSVDPFKHPKGIEHPWALVLHGKPEDGTLHTYEKRLNNLLEHLNLVGCDFGRSLLRPGTTPLPECLWDWFAGVPGKNAARPYYYTLENKKGPDEQEKLPQVHSTASSEHQRCPATIAAPET